MFNMQKGSFSKINKFSLPDKSDPILACLVTASYKNTEFTFWVQIRYTGIY